jgi:aminoglycoside phosphotransferase (APT) family kinase protein
LRGVEEFLKPDSPFLPGYNKTLNEFKKTIREIEGLEDAAEVIDLWDPWTMFRSFIIPARPMKCGFTVLNHGDDWLNNIMFKVDENGQSTAAKLIDFQIAYWGNPCGDLYYFLITSVADEVKVEHFDEFIAHYHSELSDFLKQVGYAGHIPTLTELQLELIEMRQYGG